MGQPLGQSLTQFLLIGFDRQQVVRARLLHDLSCGALLGMQGSIANEALSRSSERFSLNSIPASFSIITLSVAGCHENVRQVFTPSPEGDIRRSDLFKKLVGHSA